MPKVFSKTPGSRLERASHGLSWLDEAKLYLSAGGDCSLLYLLGIRTNPFFGNESEERSSPEMEMDYARLENEFLACIEHIAIGES
jgi:hypothetical protein